MYRRLSLSAMLACLPLCLACGEDTGTVAGFLLDEHLAPEPGESEPHPVDKGPGSGVNPDSVARAKLMWDQSCSSCHGKTGEGKGIAPALGRPGFEAKNPREHIKKIVVEGGAAVGKGVTMPPHPELADQPEVLDELVTLLEGLASYHGTPSQ